MAGNLKAILAEFIATFFFVVIGAGAVCMEALTGGRLGWTGIALAHGAAAAALALVYSRISGAQFNPAVTLCLWANGRQNVVKSVFFVFAQLLGATLAALLLKAVLHNRPELATGAPYLGACLPSDLGYKAATLVEAILTFFLVTGVYATSVEAKEREAAAPLLLGTVYAAGVLFSGPLTGGALNPARAFGPAMISGQWTYWWVYWVGPLAGAAAAGAVFEYLYLERKRP
ncbi:MAG: aquaporin [Elusimicrobia bacterium]|nr:aquaporin [Elusimicrobiota bacterium]